MLHQMVRSESDAYACDVIPLPRSNRIASSELITKGVRRASIASFSAVFAQVMHVCAARPEQNEQPYLSAGTSHRQMLACAQQRRPVDRRAMKCRWAGLRHFFYVCDMFFGEHIHLFFGTFSTVCACLRRGHTPKSTRSRLR